MSRLFVMFLCGVFGCSATIASAQTAPVTLRKCLVENRQFTNAKDPYPLRAMVDFTNDTTKTATIVRIDLFVTAGTLFMIWPRHAGTFFLPFEQTGKFAPGVVIRDNEFDFLRADLAKDEKFGDFACAVTSVDFSDGTKWRISQSEFNNVQNAYSAKAKASTPLSTATTAP